MKDIDKTTLNDILKKVDEIHQFSSAKSQFKDAIETLEAAIALNVSESTIYRMINSGIDNNSKASLGIDNKLLKQRVRCDIRIISDNNEGRAITNSPYKWTGSKSEIIEVIEGILLLGSINDGNVVKKEFYDFIGKALHVDLSNHNNILDHIYNRKDDVSDIDRRVHYLYKLINTISRKLQERDQR